MPKISHMSGTPIRNLEYSRLGLIEHVLFAPGEPRVVGFEVERPALWGLVQRRSRFVALDEAAPSDDQDDFPGLVVPYKRLPSVSASAKATGIDWDKTVIWRHMTVRTESGEDLGRVRDVVFGSKTGKVKKIHLTEGAATDAGVGRRDIAGSLVVGFDGEHVIVSDDASEKRTGGGVATAAGIGTAVAQEVVGRAAKNVADKGVELAGKTARRVKRGVREWREYLQWEEDDDE
jgi:uncharacterized protein YrrD